MNDIIVKFESPKDCVKFINTVCLPAENDGKAYFDRENKILIIKDTKLNNEKGN